MTSKNIKLPSIYQEEKDRNYLQLCFKKKKGLWLMQTKKRTYKPIKAPDE